MKEIVEAVRRCRRGDAGAYRDVVKALSPRALRFACHFLGNYLDGEDAVQEAFLQAWRRLGQLRDEEAFTGWFFQILANTARRKLRAVKIEENIDEYEYALAGDFADPERLWQRKERSAAVKDALLRLPEALRGAVILRDVEGFCYGEIARILQVPEGTVKSRLASARERLRSMLYQVEGVDTRCHVKMLEKN